MNFFSSLHNPESSRNITRHCYITALLLQVTSERSERVKFFFHENINFISSSQQVIFFLLHRYECFENKKMDEKQRKNKGMTSWKIFHSCPGCSFLWKIRVVYFSIKHSHLRNKIMYFYLS